MGFNVFMSLLIGVAIGLFVAVASLLRRTGRRVLAGVKFPRPVQNLVAGLGVAALTAFLLNQQPTVNRYIIGLIREAEKIRPFNQPLLYHERSSSYLVLMCLVIGCSIVWMITQASSKMGPAIRAAWIGVLVAGIAIAYYLDSRLEVQLYDSTLHRSMFLAGLTLMMAFVGTLYLSSRRIRSLWSGVGPTAGKAIASGATALILFCVTFSFAYIDRDQNLKTQVFYRTAETRQFIKLAQWTIDFDRDGYSRFLGGGDSDDSRADINPGAPEVVADGIDNNDIGGDLTERAVADWKDEHSSLHVGANPSARRLNIIFIFIDALRADHLGVYGYHRNTSPNIDKLAARSSVFDHGFTPAPNTFEALPKFMQSSYWDGHFETWSEALARNGYNAFLFPRRLPTLLRHVKGMRVIHHNKPKRLEQTIDIALEELENTPSERPFAAYLYATDPHREYLKHADFDFGRSLTDLYDGEVAYTDSQFGRLFDWLEQTGRIKDTMIVLMADHGESLGERGVYKHSSQLYNEQTHIPMIIFDPDLAPRHVSQYVSSIDLGPTMLNTVGIEPPSDWHGVSLLPLMRGEPFTHPPIYGEQTQKQESPYVLPEQNVNPETKKYMVITQDGYKLIYNRNFYTFELYNLKDDPMELNNLFEKMPEKSAELKRMVGRYVDILTVSRPSDADETKYRWGRADDEEEK
jgi:arylsulfatase A-like enzyme